MTDYYKILGVSEDADAKEIKAKYRKLAMKYHPDRNPDDKNAEEMFKTVSEAYEILGDENKKKNMMRKGRIKGIVITARDLMGKNQAGQSRTANQLKGGLRHFSVIFHKSKRYKEYV